MAGGQKKAVSFRKRRLLVALMQAGDRVHYGARALWLTVFCWAAVLISGIALLALPQGREILLAFNAQTLAGRSKEVLQTLHLAMLVGAVLLLALACWYPARLLLGYRFRDDPHLKPHVQRFAARLRRWWPRLLGAGCVLPASWAYALAVPTVHPPVTLLWLLAAQVGLVCLMLRQHAPGQGPGRLFTACSLGITGLALAQALAWLPLGGLPLWEPPGLPLLAVGFALTWFLWMRVGTPARLRALLLTFSGAALAGFVAIDADLLIAALFFVAGNGLLAVLVARRNLFSSALPQDAAGTYTRLPRSSKGVVLSALALSYALAAALYVEPVAVGRALGAPAIIALALSSAVLTGSLVLILWPKSYRLPALVLLPLPLVIVAAQFNDNHAIRAEGFARNDPRPAPAEHFAGWRKADPTRDRGPVFVVAASGGGLRAAYWTASVLAHLDDETCGEFGRRLYALSGVSGGSLGSAIYVALLADRKAPPACEDTGAGGRRTVPAQRLAPRIQPLLGADFLSPALGAMLFPDALQRFVPWPLMTRDRAYALETSWEHQWQAVLGTSRLARPFLDLYDGGRDRRLPSLLLNSTTVEEGKRIVASNLRFAPLDAFDLLSGEFRTAGMPLSTAVHNSARFTFLSPAGTLLGAPSPDSRGSAEPAGRLVDGGYFENSGAATAQELAADLRRAAPQAQIVPVLISNDQADRRWCSSPREKALQQEADPLDDTAPARPKRVDDPPWLPETGAPLTTLLRTREARGSLSQLAFIQGAAPSWAQACGIALELSMTDVPVDVVPEGPMPLPCGHRPARPVPLGWYTSRASQCLMDNTASLYAQWITRQQPEPRRTPATH
jgi:hypothetical protein